MPRTCKSWPSRARIRQYKSNLTSLQTLSGYYQNSLNTISNILTSAKQLAVQMASDTQDATTRAAAASQVNGDGRASSWPWRTQRSGIRIYSAEMNAEAAPYSRTAHSSVPASVGQVAVDSSSTMAAGISGNTIFDGSLNGQTVNIFTTLSQFATDLSNNDTDALQTDLNNIGNCVDATANNLSYVGTYANNISSLLTTNSNTDTALSTTSSDLVSVDMAQAVSDYTTLSTAYQAAIYTLAKAPEPEHTQLLAYIGKGSKCSYYPGKNTSRSS